MEIWRSALSLDIFLVGHVLLSCEPGTTAIRATARPTGMAMLRGGRKVTRGRRRSVGRRGGCRRRGRGEDEVRVLLET